MRPCKPLIGGDLTTGSLFPGSHRGLTKVAKNGTKCRKHHVKEGRAYVKL